MSNFIVTREPKQQFDFKGKSLSEEDKKEILSSNRTKEDATKLAEAIKERYR